MVFIDFFLNVAGESPLRAGKNEARRVGSLAHCASPNARPHRPRPGPSHDHPRRLVDSVSIGNKLFAIGLRHKNRRTTSPAPRVIPEHPPTRCRARSIPRIPSKGKPPDMLDQSKPGNDPKQQRSLHLATSVLRRRHLYPAQSPLVKNDITDDIMQCSFF